MEYWMLRPNWSAIGIGLIVFISMRHVQLHTTIRLTSHTSASSHWRLLFILLSVSTATCKGSSHILLEGRAQAAYAPGGGRKRGAGRDALFGLRQHPRRIVLGLILPNLHRLDSIYLKNSCSVHGRRCSEPSTRLRLFRPGEHH